jgi:hypothetical protein
MTQMNPDASLFQNPVYGFRYEPLNSYDAM